jgi:hypothetical protein
MDMEPVKQWQIMQDTTGIRVLVRPSPPRFNAEHLAGALTEALRQQRAAPIPIVIEEVESIPKATSGNTPLIRAARR